ncbi:4183_t:CDS:2 [Paraglomus occultum]|uniref:Gamma-soluble NSF attachment protein n=1 Tax=Paraglomus occultum TaxID=144539 RepID=A0A9N9B647_9GLOM|nr:4183_t:CDS:2 [Paraglomus occultum]
MIGLIVLCAFLYGSYKTNPDAASFRAFIRPPNSNSTTDSLTNFFASLVNAHTMPEFKRDDYIFFSIVSLADNTETYLGLWGQWFLLSKLQLIGGGKGASAEENELQLFESVGEAEKALAVKAKLKRDLGVVCGFLSAYDSKRISADTICSFDIDASAASHYNEAAEQFLQAGVALDAAQCYEDAYKAYQQAKQTEKAVKTLEKAASLYESHDTQMSRAANVYVKLAEQYKKDNSTSKDLDKAVAMYKKAADLYGIEGDGRHFFTVISQADLLAEIGQYEDAIKLYDNIILFAIGDSMLNFNVKTHIFNQLLCYAGLDDWVGLEKKAVEMEATYPTFAESRECQLIKTLIQAKNAFDSSAYSTACKDYDQRSTLPSWQINILLKGKRSLESEDLR